MLRCLGLFAYAHLAVYTAHLQVCLKASWTLAAAIFANVVNALVSYGLVFGIGPVPSLGVVGSAWGSVTAEVLAAVTLLAMVRRQTRQSHGPLRESSVEHGTAPEREGRVFARVTAFELGNNLTLFASEAIFIWMISRLGERELGAGQIALEVTL